MTVHESDVPRVVRYAGLRPGRPKETVLERRVQECVCIYRRALLRLIHDGLQLGGTWQSPTHTEGGAKCHGIVPGLSGGDISLPRQSCEGILNRPVLRDIVRRRTAGACGATAHLAPRTQRTQYALSVAPGFVFPRPKST